MHIPEKFTQAELTFNYNHYPHFLKLADTNKAGQVLLKLWQEECQCSQARKYVLFLDANNQLIAWKHLASTLDDGYCAREIAGMAIACNASSIILSHNRLSSPTPNQSDKTLIAKAFEICEQFRLEILDYLIITPKECVSYKLWLLN